MEYTVKVSPAHVREQQIAQLVKDSDRKEAFHAYQNREIELPVIWVSNELPIYRMANFRTRIAQQSYIRRENVSPNFFRKGQENEAAQQQQHIALVKFAQQGRAGSVTPIIDVLETEGQHDAILITSAGVVVNGNRRLAGMRHLFASDAKFKNFSHVKCLVMPLGVTESDIVDTEIRLQMKQRTELEYEWINECLAIKEMRDNGKSIPDLMALMNKKKKEVEEAIDALVEADLYLTDWLRQPGNYEAIEDAEQLFYDIGSSVGAKSGIAQELARRIAWTLVDRRKKLKRRVYDFNPMFGKKADEVAAKLAEKQGVEVDASDNDQSDADDIELDLGGSDSSSLKPLIAIFDDPVKREQIGSDLVGICEDIIETEKGEKDGLATLNTVQRANALLSGIDITKALPESLPAIGKQLSAIQVTVTRLQSVIAAQNASKPKK